MRKQTNLQEKRVSEESGVVVPTEIDASRLRGVIIQAVVELTIGLQNEEGDIVHLQQAKIPIGTESNGIMLGPSNPKAWGDSRKEVVKLKDKLAVDFQEQKQKGQEEA